MKADELFLRWLTDTSTQDQLRSKLTLIIDSNKSPLTPTVNLNFTTPSPTMTSSPTSPRTSPPALVVSRSHSGSLSPKSESMSPRLTRKKSNEVHLEKQQHVAALWAMRSPVSPKFIGPFSPDLPQFYFRFGRPDAGSVGSEMDVLQRKFSLLGEKLKKEHFSMIVKVVPCLILLVGFCLPEGLPVCSVLL